jgi:hypothetical protein
MSSRLKRAFSLLLASLFLFAPIPESSHAAVGDTDSYLSLNGTNQYVDVAQGTDFAPRGTYTVEAWFNPSSITCTFSGSTGCSIVSHPGDFNLMIGDSTIRVELGFNGNLGSTSIATGNTPVANTWQHIALVKSGASVTIYLNGSSIATSTISGYSSAATSGNSFRVGYDSYSRYFAGGIDEVRLYSSALTQAEIRTDMVTWGPVNASGLVAYYDFNDASGSKIENKVSGSTSTTELTLRNTPTYSTIESTTVSGIYTTVTFGRSYLNANGGWKVPSGLGAADVLVVAGGGGGSGGNTNPGICESGGGGGGGGGQVRTLTAQTLAQGSVVAVQVGAGGVGGAGGVNGSVFGKAGGSGFQSFLNSITATGGGGGGTTTTACKASPGGTSGNGTYAGGSVSAINSGGGGGGGGNAAIGGNGSTASGSTGGNGGAGSTSSVTGSTYGGGGGGGINEYIAGGNTTVGTGGAGGGGTGKVGFSNAAPNTGGGGGGGTGGGGGSGSVGGIGAAGIVAIKFIQSATVNTFALNGGATTAVYRVAININFSVTQQSKVTFTLNGKVLPGCKNRTTSGNGSTWVYNCSWKPSLHGVASIVATATPLSGTGQITSNTIRIPVTSRTGYR